MTEEHNSVTNDLEIQGWIRQFIIESERAAEYEDLYESLGRKVHKEFVTPGMVVAEECATCLLATCDRYVVIYTRRIEQEHGSEV